MRKDELKSKGIKAVFWNLAGSIMKHGSTFIFSIFLARLLSPEEFALVAMAMVFIALSQSLVDFGLSAALVQAKEPSEVHCCTIFYINIAMATILMILAIFSSEFIASYYHNEEISSLVRFVSYTFVINALNSVQLALLTKALKNKIKTIASLLHSVITGIVGVILAYLGFGVWALVYSALIGSIVHTCYIWHKSTWRPQLLFNIQEIKPHFKFGFNIFATGLISTIYDKIDVLIIGKMFTPTTLGLYYKARSFSELVTKYGATSLAGVLFPIFSHIQDDIEQVKKIAHQVMHMNTFLTFWLIGLLYLIGSDLIILLFGEKWSDSVPYFKLLLLGSYAYAVRIVLFNILNGIGKSRVTLVLDIVSKFVGVIAILIGFIWGIKGYLIALACVALISSLISYKAVDREIQWPWYKQFGILITYTIPWVLIVYIMSNLHFSEWRVLNILINTFLFTLCYCIFNRIFRTTGLIQIINLFKRYIIAKYA